jgi:hypothetical protein
MEPWFKDGLKFAEFLEKPLETLCYLQIGIGAAAADARAICSRTSPE